MPGALPFLGLRRLVRAWAASGSQVYWGLAWPKSPVVACVACCVVGRLRCQMRCQKFCIALSASAVVVVTVVVVMYAWWRVVELQMACSGSVGGFDPLVGG